MESLGALRRLALASVLLLVLASACASGGGSPAPPGGPGPRLTFKERTHDFGKISASRAQQRAFAFTNTGTERLQVGEITLAPAAAGGCT